MPRSIVSAEPCLVFNNTCCISEDDLFRRIDVRRLLTTILGSLITIIPSVALAQNANSLAGSGVVIGTHGEILTNAHVVEDCEIITVQSPLKMLEKAVLLARDQKNDLAVIRIATSPSTVAAFREGSPLRTGDSVVALGYPLSGILASTASLSVGTVSALAGLG
jgi:hypothetical protein